MKQPLDFRSFGFSDALLEGLEAMGFNTPTPIQEQAIPEIQKGDDIIACAQTGTGKTAAYILPVLDRIYKEQKTGTSVIVIVPTRELAQQVDQEIEGFSYFLDISSLAIYGGGDSDVWDQQKKAIEQGVEVIVGTPGRLMTHMKMAYMDLSRVDLLILDEADRMLDMGFQEDILAIMKGLPEKRQSLLFSATMPPEIRKFSQSILNNPAEVSIAVSAPAERVIQVAYLAYDAQKTPLLEHLLKGKEENLQSVLVFASTKRKVAELGKQLKQLGLGVKTISSDLDQNEREEVLRQFRNRKFPILIATDVLSRGIDIKSIDLIINFDVPQDPEDYVHRIGRTARAEESGLAISLINEDDQSRFARIEDLIKSEVKKLPLPASIGEGPAYEPRKKSKGGRSGPFKKGKKPFHRKKGS